MGKFVKGHKTNIAKKKKSHSEKAKIKMRLAHLGKKWTSEVREKMKNRIPWNKGKKSGQKMSEEAKEILRKRMKGNSYTKGVTYPLEIRRRFGSPKETHPNWKGGITPINESIRKSIEYKLWRKSVFQRDCYKCIWCDSTKKIHADHIRPFCNYPELRFSIDNGRTLCEKCHKSTNTWGSRARNY